MLYRIFVEDLSMIHLGDLNKRQVSIRFSASYYNPIYVPMPGYYGKAEINTNQEYNIEKEN